MSDSDKIKGKIHPVASGRCADDGRPHVLPGDDLGSHVKATLKDYLRDLSGNNPYHINHRAWPNPNNEEELISGDEEASIYPDEGSSKISTIIADLPDSSGKHPGFLQSSDSQAQSKFINLSDSGQFTHLEERYNTLRTFFDKSERGAGHKLLRDIKPSRKTFWDEDAIDRKKAGIPEPNTAHFEKTPEGAPEQQKRISSILKKGNRFTPSSESPFLVTSLEGDTRYSLPQGSLGTIHHSLGVHTLNTPLGNLAIEDVRKIGLDLITRQTGHKLDDPTSGDWLKEPATILPAGWFDNRVPVGDLSVATSKIGHEKTSHRPRLNVGYENNFSDGSDYEKFNDGYSYGAAFSHFESFTGASLPHATMILTGLSTTMLAGTVIGIFLELLYKTFEDERAQGKDPASLSYGMWTDAPEAELAKHGIPYLTYPVFSSIAAGLVNLFGLSRGKYLPENGFLNSYLNNFIMLIGWFTLTLLLNIREFIGNLGSNKGFWVTLVRSAMRDNHKLFDGDLWKEVAMDMAAAIASSAFGGQEILKNVLLTVVSKFISLSNFKFFMAVAVMGDKTYEGEIADFSGLHTPIDLLPDNGQTRIYKSRVNKISNALSWRHRSAPSLMWLPGETFGGMEIMGGTPSAAITAAIKIGDREGTEAFRRKVIFQSQSKSAKYRIDPDDVLEMENQLEAEYMPFYFHDLRTNEIISFHAFISDIKDSFSVEYNDTSGFGRIDSVKIYKKTQRSINLSFWIVSTSQEDFDSMWFSVNKLTQLVYPQWSTGAVVSDGEQGFTMPNSQIMTSSPLVRLRVGDFVRSNSSRFNLAKLFGVHDSAGFGDLKFQGKAEPTAYKAAKSVDEAAVKAKNFISNFYDPESFKKSDPKFAILKMSTTHGYVAKSTEKPLIPLITSPPPLFRVWTRQDAVVKISSIKARPGAGKKPKTNLGESGYSKQPIQVEVEFKDPNDVANPMSDKYSMFVLPSDLRPIVSGTDIGTPNDNLKAANFAKTAKFLSADSSDGNPVFNAARSTAGRGLAGFITSLDFDYGESTYETASLTRRAPKMIKVSISFAPIHDIAPGLDHMGGMRAPLYPVGDIMSQLSQDPLRNLHEYGQTEFPANTIYGQGATKAKAFTGEPLNGKSPGESFRKSAATVSKAENLKKGEIK